MTEATKHLHVYGRVQGVCYRAWAVETAHQLGLSGWVRNRRDGTVELVVHGSDIAVQQMIEQARRGPPAARVERIAVVDAEKPVTAGFGTRPTA